MGLANLERDQLGAAIAASPVKPFLVTLDRAGKKVLVHVAREAVTTSAAIPGLRWPLRREFSRRFSAAGLDRPVRVRMYGRSILERPRSIESFVARCCPGERLYDPTRVFDEAADLVAFAGRLRDQLESDLGGVYWNARWRTAYVLLNKDAFFDRDQHGVRRHKLIAAERATLAAHDARARTDVARNVRLCFGLPGMQPLVPVDDVSFRYAQAQGKPVTALLHLATWARIPVLGALLGIGSTGLAIAKMPPIEKGPVLTRMALPGDEPKASFGSAETFSKDRAIPGTQVAGLQATALPRSEGCVERDHFTELAKSGATFDSMSNQLQYRRFDLRWLPDGENAGRPGRRLASHSFPAMQPGIAGILGLSSLTENDLSDESYGEVLTDVLVHFGLPSALHHAASLYIGGLVNSAPDRGGAPLDRKLLAQQGESYWEWLRRMGPRNTEDNRYPNSPVQPPTKGSRPPCSSC